MVVGAWGMVDGVWYRQWTAESACPPTLTYLAEKGLHDTTHVWIGKNRRDAVHTCDGGGGGSGGGGGDGGGGDSDDGDGDGGGEGEEAAVT